jgi:hypothetical protein
MSEIEQNPEQSTGAEQPTEKIEDLPPKKISEHHAESVRGGSSRQTFDDTIASKAQR